MKAIVIGAGLCGSVIARNLAENNFQVTVIDQRKQIGGNMYDCKDKYGVTIHKYGPHCFHTNNKKLIDYMMQYESWERFYCTCGAEINNICTPSPFNFRTVVDFFGQDEGDEIIHHLLMEYPNRKTVTVLEALNSSDYYVKKYAEFLFKNDYSLYTAKQWGLRPDEIDSTILKRVPLKLSYEEGYFDDLYQYLPKHSYKTFSLFFYE